MEINQTTYETLKRSVSGFYFKFNTQVLRFYMNKIWDYENLLETAKKFNTFTEFYEFHTSGKKDLIEQYVKEMYQQALYKNLGPKEEWVRNCVIVRLGNIYNGMFTENKILETFSTLSPYIKCEKSEKEIDMLYKVDGIVELAGIDKLAIQIKPVSFLTYDKGSEIEFHKRFELEFGIKVFYVFYKDKSTIVFNDTEIKLIKKEKIIEQIEKILVYK